eukprot:1155962-Pelagomonas_calceolata.AAC.15
MPMIINCIPDAHRIKAKAAKRRQEEQQQKKQETQRQASQTADPEFGTFERFTKGGGLAPLRGARRISSTWVTVHSSDACHPYGRPISFFCRSREKGLGSL